MPSAKQKRARNESTPGKTLHDFFNAKAANGNAGTPSKVQSKNDGKPPKSQGKTTIKTFSSTEIIVIDSDSDDDMPKIVEVTSSVKRRRLSPKNSEDKPIIKKEQTSITSVSVESKENASSFTITHSRTIKREDSMFGAPILLCPNPPAEPPVEEPSFTCEFGQPNILLSASTITASTSTTTLASSGVKDETQVDIDLTLDFWENGDDEVEGDIKTEQIQEDDVIETLKAEDGNDWANDHQLLEDDFQMPPYEEEDIKPSRSGMDSCPSTSAIDVDEAEDLPKPSTSNPNAFSFLMSSFKEKEVWKEADVAEDKSFRATSTSRRKAPFYKVLQGMPIAVDAFKYGAIPGVRAYFLTHAHSDHYTNLSSSWKHGPIYCSLGTANLIIHMLSVHPSYVHALPMDVPTLVPNTNGVTVTLIEANHCPGSCLFLFEGKQTVNAGDSTYKSKFVGGEKVWRYLHCGDFRASPRHVEHPAVKGKKIDHVYLDTTYLDPKYTFPPQPQVISACADLVKKLVDGNKTPDCGSNMLSWLAPSKGKGKDKQQSKPLIVVGTYSIGKERIVKAIAHALDTKVYCDSRKASILRCQADSELDALLTSNPKESLVHLVPLATIATDRLKIYLERFDGMYDRVVGFRPTGWTYTPTAGADLSPSVSTILSKASQSNFTHADLKLSPKSTPDLQLYPVPYSEHSSFNELTCFAMSFTWTKMIATVNVGSESSRAKMAKWVAKWEAERRKRGQDSTVLHRHPDYW